MSYRKKRHTSKLVQLGLLLVGQAGVDDAGDGHIPAARHLPHSGDPVLSVHHMISRIPIKIAVITRTRCLRILTAL